MIRTTIQYTVKIQYDSETKNDMYRETREGFLETVLDHCRQEHMLGSFDDEIVFTDVVSSRVTSSEIIEPVKDY